MLRRILALAAAFMAFVPRVAAETRYINVNTGIDITFPQLMRNITTFLAASIGTITVVAFLCGAVLMVYSQGEAGRVEKAKKLMINSLQGMAIVLGSYTIMRTVLWFLYI